MLVATIELDQKPDDSVVLAEMMQLSFGDSWKYFEILDAEGRQIPIAVPQPAADPNYPPNTIVDPARPKPPEVVLAGNDLRTTRFVVPLRFQSKQPREAASRIRFTSPTYAPPSQKIADYLKVKKVFLDRTDAGVQVVQK